MTPGEEAEKDATFKGIHDHYRAFMESNVAWNVISEPAYARALTL